MSSNRSRTPRPPLDAGKLRALALHYVGRYATTRAKLAAYLRRKVAERGWTGDELPISDLVTQIAEASYIDDRAFAENRSAALGRRGYGERRIGAALSAAGIDRDTISDLAHDDDAAFDAAETYARRKRIGPFAAAAADPAGRQRAFAAMARAGHPYHLARLFTAADPGDFPNRDG